MDVHVSHPALRAIIDAGRPRPQRMAPAWLQRIHDRLHASVGQRLSVIALARSEGLHPVYLTRRFRQAYGVSVGTYLRRLKIYEGARKLLQGHDTLSKIAHDLAFADQSHFCRCFHAVMHMTPMEYRRLLLQYAWRTRRIARRGRVVVPQRQVRNVQYTTTPGV
jgi:AraC-like DNA-binding protein